MTTKTLLIPGLLAVALLAFSGCTDSSKKSPRGKTRPGVVTKIDLQTRNVAMKIKQEDSSEVEHSGTISDDTEILINGRGAKLADVRVGDTVDVTVQKSKTEEGKYDVKKVEVTRTAEADWKPTNSTTQPPATPTNTANPVTPPASTPPASTPPDVKPVPTNPPATNPPPTNPAPADPMASNQGSPTSPVSVPDMGMDPDAEQKKADLADLIYAQIRVRMEEALARRANLLKAGTPQSDTNVADFERQILRARSFLEERGEILEEVAPPLAGLPPPDSSATAASADTAPANPMPVNAVGH